MTINPVLLKLAQCRVWTDASGQVKRAFQPGAAAGGGAQPPGGGGAPPPPGAPPGAPPGGMMPTMDPAAAGAAGVPPMGDPSQMGMMQAAPQPQGGSGSGKPKFDPLMLDYRMYNLQQQLSAIMNALNIEVPPQALIMPPGTMGAPPAEQALPGGPMDPAMQAQAMGGGQGGPPGAGGPPGGGMAAMMGGKQASAPLSYADFASQLQAAGIRNLPPEVAEFQKDANANAPVGWQVVLVKQSGQDTEEPEGGKKSSPPSKELNVAGAPGTRPATQAISAGGSKDPKSRPETDADMGPVNKSAADAEHVGTPFPSGLFEPAVASPTVGAAALAAVLRSRTQGAA